MPRLTPDEARMLGERLIWGPEEAAPEEVGPEGLGAGVFGRYHLVRLIGQGGMGSVYEAEQESPKRRVAIKVIRPELMSAEVARRFEHEARILGRLQHPGIAQIYEAGRVEGGGGGATPYFAMEFVEGVPLTEFAKAGGLGVRARLELFLRACEAVEHAHRMGVIHRDLKPGNILVDTEGRARILDFGVARATDADVRAATMHTEMGRLLGTLPYMSPEQVAGDADGLDTRSDVYSLGVVLYELLAERPPYEVKRGPVHEAARVITETEPAPLSTVSRVYRGDLETIVGKALAKERERRYQSVGELAADIRRYLSDEPIVARRAGKWYQWRKFAKRNRAFVSALIVVAAILVVASVVSLALAVVASRAGATAERSLTDLHAAQSGLEREAKRSDAISGFFRSALLSVDPAIAQGHETTLREFLAMTAKRLEQGGVEDARAAAEVRAVIGEAYRRLGDLGAAERNLGAALQEQRALPEGVPPEATGVMNNLALTYKATNRLREAAALLREVVRIRSETEGERAPPTLTAMNNLAGTLDELNEFDEAGALYLRVFSIRTEVLGPDSQNTLTSQVNLSQFLRRQGRLAEAEPLIRDAVLRCGAVLGENHPLTLSALQHLSVLLSDQGKADEAISVVRSLLERRRHVFGDESVEVFSATASLGMALMDAEQLDEAEDCMRLAVAGRSRVQGEDSLDTLATQANLAVVLSAAGEYPEAEAIARHVMERQGELLGPGHPKTLLTTNTVADLTANRGAFSDALKLSQRAIEGGTSVKGLRPRDLAAFIGVRGRCLTGLGRYEEAEVDLKRCREILIQEKASRRMVDRSESDLRSLYLVWGKQVEAHQVEETQEGGH